MSRIRARGNRSTELALIRLLRAHRLNGWRRNAALFGKPDLVFPAFKLAVFVDGEFWHGHPTRGRIPESNQRYWLQKIARNRARDKTVTLTLKRRGWRVVRIWEHQLKAQAQARAIARLKAALGKSR
jgi:DNA mismatch endonuclease, patch repair protein